MAIGFEHMDALLTGVLFGNSDMPGRKGVFFVLFVVIDEHCSATAKIAAPDEEMFGFV